MIVYSAFYETGKRPLIRKTIEAVDGSIVDTGINFYNEEEREFITDEIVQQHIDNLHQYFKDVAVSSTMIPIGGNQTSYIIKEWDKLSDVFQEITSWWIMLSYKAEDDESDHYHDPVTGEHVTDPATEEPTV